MNFDELINFINTEDGRLRQYFGYTDEEKRILSRAVKLGEEVGELNAEVLSFISMQRKEKLEQMDKANLSKEFADVIITTLLLAKITGVDVREALKTKIEIINKRYQDK